MQNKIDAAKNNNGILFLVVKNDRLLKIEVGYALEGVLPDVLTSSIIKNVVISQLRDGNYYKAIVEGISAIKSAAKGEYSANQKVSEEEPFGNFLIPFILL